VEVSFKEQFRSGENEADCECYCGGYPVAGCLACAIEGILKTHHGDEECKGAVVKREGHPAPENAVVEIVLLSASHVEHRVA